jgi:hypothetical protein
VARHVACDPAVSEPERALHAALCGHLPALLPSFPTFAGHLWAYARAAVEHRVSAALGAGAGAAGGALADPAAFRPTDLLSPIVRSSAAAGVCPSFFSLIPEAGDCGCASRERRARRARGAL